MLLEAAAATASAGISNTLTVVLAIFASITAPLILALFFQRQQRKNRDADYARQDALAAQARAERDEVARQAAIAAADLIRSNKSIADKAEANNQLVAQTAARQSAQLGSIHTLVNSNLTVAKQSELTALRGQLILVDEVISLKQDNGLHPTKDTLAERDRIQEKITELSLDLSDRANAAAALALEDERERERETNVRHR